MFAKRLSPAVLLVFTTAAFAQLSIAPARLPDAGVGANYYVEFHATGGAAPYKWTSSGSLPDGLEFDNQAATLAGIPTKAGDSTFSIIVTDASGRSATRRYTLRITGRNTISIAWTRPPVVANGAISGEVEISNPGSDTFDLTFIAVAVNEIGRATALGYQRFNLGPGKQRVPFSTTLPRGTYVVHADAIGEIARTRTVRRARLQTEALGVP